MTDDLTAIARRLDELEKGPQELKQSLAEAESDRDAYRRLYLETMGRCRKLRPFFANPDGSGKDSLAKTSRPVLAIRFLSAFTSSLFALTSAARRLLAARFAVQQGRSDKVNSATPIDRPRPRRPRPRRHDLVPRGRLHRSSVVRIGPGGLAPAKLVARSKAVENDDFIEKIYYCPGCFNAVGAYFGFRSPSGKCYVIGGGCFPRGFTGDHTCRCKLLREGC